MQSHQDVIDFWFVEHGPDDWFGGKAEFDTALATRFADLHPQVARGEACQSWGNRTPGHPFPSMPAECSWSNLGPPLPPRRHLVWGTAAADG